MYIVLDHCMDCVHKSRGDKQWDAVYTLEGIAQHAFFIYFCVCMCVCVCVCVRVCVCFIGSV